MKKNINTLEELEREQQKLKMTMELTKQAFAENLGTNRHQLKDFLLKKVALPTGAVGLSYAAIKKAVAAANDKKENKQEKSSSVFLEKIFPLLISVGQAYFFKQQGKEAANNNFNHSNKNNVKQPFKKAV